MGNINRLTKKDSAGVTITTHTFSYDQLSQLVRENDVDNNFTAVYTYDNGGNMVQKKVYAYTTATDLSALTPTQTINYQYGDTNWKDKLTSYNGQAITYDAIGNPLTYRDGMTMTWTQGRRLASLEYKDVATLSFAYDADGLRVKKYSTEGDSSFYYANGQLSYELRDNKHIYYLYDAYGTPTAICVDGTYYFYVTNSRGDVVQIYDDLGHLQVNYSYDAWGNCKVLDVFGYEISKWNHIGHLNPLRYRGYYYDKESGLYYCQSRYYDPTTHRFLNADNQVSAGSDLTGMNLFAYCGNNPVNRVDPTGHAWWHWAVAAAVVVGCVVATVVTAGGFAAGAAAIGMAAGGVSVGGAAGVFAAASIGSGMALAGSAMIAASTSNSIGEFNKKGNWGTVAGTAGGAIWGGGSAYVGAKGLSSTKSTRLSKVTVRVKNNVIDFPRTGSALKIDAHHAFPNIVDNYAGYATKTTISNGTLYQLQGSLNGTTGRFEWITQNGQVTHRMFVGGGGINGIPIMP